MKSNLELVDYCDSVPYAVNLRSHTSFFGSVYTLVWEEEGIITPIGYITDFVFDELKKVPVSVKGDLEVNRAERHVTVFHQATEAERSAKVKATVSYWQNRKAFKILSGWRNELYPVYGPGNKLLYNIERSASPLIGVVTYGVHMTAYVRDSASSYGLMIWVPRRAAGKQTYGGMLDNTVAGGLASGEDRLDCLVRESEEEANLPSELVRSSATSHGTVTYLYVRTQEATGEVGLIQPECQYVYDLELPLDVTPKPNDNEVEGFYLWTVEEVQEHLANGEFKPNTVLILLDFFIRHEILTPENEKNYDEIKRRIHRVLEFPGPHKSFE